MRKYENIISLLYISLVLYYLLRFNGANIICLTLPLFKKISFNFLYETPNFFLCSEISSNMIMETNMSDKHHLFVSDILSQSALFPLPNASLRIYFLQMWLRYIAGSLPSQRTHYNFYFLQICSRLIFWAQLLTHYSARYKILSITAYKFNIILSLF